MFQLYKKYAHWMHSCEVNELNDLCSYCLRMLRSKSHLCRTKLVFGPMTCIELANLHFGALELTLHSKSLSYNFLHLSVQELLAAYHISNIDSSKQLEVFKRMFGGSRFQAVLHYYSAFTKLANPAIQDFIHNENQVLMTFCLCCTVSMKYKSHLCAS